MAPPAGCNGQSAHSMGCLAAAIFREMVGGEWVDEDHSVRTVHAHLIMPGVAASVAISLKPTLSSAAGD